MTWRPKEWENPYDREDNLSLIGTGYLQRKAFEEGADAMLEALKKNARWEQHPRIRVKIILKELPNPLTEDIARLWVKSFERELKGYYPVERLELEDYKPKEVF